MSYIAIPTRTEADLNSSADINQLMANIEYLKERIENYPLEVLYPVGARYIQFPEPDGSWNPAEAPGNKFGGLWVLRFATEGTFFKTEGHEPAQYYKDNVLTAYRTNGLAEDKQQQIYGEIYNVGVGGFNRGFGPGSLTQIGALRMDVFTGGRYSSGSGSDDARRLSFNSRLSSNAKTTLDTDGRTEPTNRLMRIYERIE